jgi:hypothetical protein
MTNGLAILAGYAILGALLIALLLILLTREAGDSDAQ